MTLSRNSFEVGKTPQPLRAADEAKPLGNTEPTATLGVGTADQDSFTTRNPTNQRSARRQDSSAPPSSPTPPRTDSPRKAPGLPSPSPELLARLSAVMRASPGARLLNAQERDALAFACYAANNDSSESESDEG